LLQLRKASDSMGLSIVAARGTGQQQLGIYIKSVVKGC
jgi:afadin